MLSPRPHLYTLAPYKLPDTSAPPAVRQLQLAQNESAYGPSAATVAAMQSAVANVRLYPDPNFTALREAIADVHRLPPQQILCGGGSLALIDLIAQAYLSADDSVVASQFSYLFFRTAAKKAGAETILIPEPNLTVDVELLLDGVRPNTRIVFVANPGNPSGTHIPNGDIVRLRDQLRDDIMLIVDEAYAEYVEPAADKPLFHLVERRNTVVLRTFSKMYGLAGMRVGWGYFPFEMIDILRRIQNPNTVTSVTQAGAVAAVQDQAFVTSVRNQTRQVRDQLTADLAALGLNPVPSTTNFVLCQLSSAEAAQLLSDQLRTHGIIVRQMVSYGLPHCLRITLGTAAEMDEVVQTLKALIISN